MEQQEKIRKYKKFLKIFNILVPWGIIIILALQLGNAMDDYNGVAKACNDKLKEISILCELNQKPQYKNFIFGNYSSMNIKMVNHTGEEDEETG